MKLKNVLVIEDDPDTADAIAAILRAYECNPVIAYSRNEALTKLDDNTDAIVTDYMMPGLMLVNFISSLRLILRRRVPVVVCSAYKNAESEAKRLGLAFIAKPFTAEALVHAIAEAPTA